MSTEVILEKFYSSLTDEEKKLLTDYLKDPTSNTLSKSFDSLVEEMQTNED